MIAVTNMKHNKKKLFCAFCLAALSIFAFINFGRQQQSTHTDYLHYYARSTSLTEKIIFLWTPKQGSYNGWSFFGANPNISECDSQSIDEKCLITTDPDLLEKADVVLFSIQDIKRVNNWDGSFLALAKGAFPHLPSEIRMKQLWLIVWYESNKMLSHYHHVTDSYLQSLDGIFNGTLSHRSDSLIQANFYSYNCYYIKAGSLQIKPKKWKAYEQSAISKPRLVSWFVSHCNAPNRREDYVTAMKKHIHVDIYGKCSEYSSTTTALNSKEEKKILAQYKFYLSFENSNFPEYVTEKVYKILNLDLKDNPPVPIVMGPNISFYKKILPYKSFIHVDEFKNAEQLKNYLQILDSRPDLYLEYLNWKKYYRLVCEHNVGCKTCNLLLKSRNNSNYETFSSNKNDFIISDFKAFWNKAKCQG